MPGLFSWSAHADSSSAFCTRRQRLQATPRHGCVRHGARCTYLRRPASCCCAPAVPGMGAPAGVRKPKARRAQPGPPGCCHGARVRRRTGTPGRQHAVVSSESPPPGKRDAFGGWTLAAPQKWWGHRAEKETWFYVVGCEPGDMPDLPYSMAEATHVVQSRKRQDCRPHITKAEREHTPPELAVWLVELARRCTLQPQPA